MRYTVGYRGYTIWRDSDREPFKISYSVAGVDLVANIVSAGFRDFASARREVDALPRRS